MPLPLPVALPSLARGSHLCCLSKCCPCVNLQFLKTTEGILKLLEVILGSICQNLLIWYSLTYTLTLGSSYHSFLTTCSACMMTSFILLVTYVISAQSVHTLRSSLFELLFNAFGSFLYLTSSCFLAIAVHTYLYPLHKLGSIFEAFPTMSSTYITGFILSATHAYDAYLAFNT